MLFNFIKNNKNSVSAEESINAFAGSRLSAYISFDFLIFRFFSFNIRDFGRFFCCMPY